MERLADGTEERTKRERSLRILSRSADGIGLKAEAARQRMENEQEARRLAATEFGDSDEEHGFKATGRQRLEVPLLLLLSVSHHITAPKSEH